MYLNGNFPVLTAEEAASFIHHNDLVAFSGFSPAGAAKVVPSAIASRAKELHQKGEAFKIRVLTGASSSNAIDKDLVEADAVSWRAPYQGVSAIRQRINAQDVEYIDMHLSAVPQTVDAGFFGKVNVAVIEATEITADGRVYLTTSIGASPTFLKCADKVIIEINSYHSPRLREMADISIMPPPPRRNPIPIFETMTRIGWPYATVDPSKVLGVVLTDKPDEVMDFNLPDDVSKKIAGHVVDFLVKELRLRSKTQRLYPFQAGVGNVANAVLSALGENEAIPPFYMYTEVMQDAMVDLMLEGKLLGASACSLTVTAEKLKQIVSHMDLFGSHVVLRPQEFSNHPGIIRRLGVIALNTALEVDIYGNANSSHIYGTDVLNGIGGSGEFTRNAYLSVLMTPSTAKNDKISAIVPMCPHVDNNEHSVQVIVTEQGLADLRGLGPAHRAEVLIETCAHPKYRDYLYQYVKDSRKGHIRHNLEKCFELHRNLMHTGQMLP
ncbi:succinate CoA transferase [bacterium]|nr:succinate CoA transferase [bacterium]